MILLDVASWVLIVIGSFACVTAGIGLIRLPDFFCRSHAGGIMDSLGMGCLFLGMALQTSNPLVLIKLFFIYTFILLTGPTAIHALARAALHAGIKPIDGQHTGGDASTR
ncbi:MAG: monovalent cation/H(+) antiporter subunit G [Pseudomonadota bacterium]